VTERALLLAAVTAAVAPPALAALLLAAAALLDLRPPERLVARVALLASVASLAAVAAGAIAFARGPEDAVELVFPPWFAVGGYVFRGSALVDRLSLTTALTAGVIVAVVARFSVRYLHREPGFLRFFLLLCAFAAGMQLLVLAGSFDVLFMGWEVVGVASVLLIAFFDRRPGPVAGALRAMVTYRLTDIGLLVAAVLLHQLTGSSEFADAFHAGAWPRAATGVPTGGVTWVALLLALSAMGKSAQFPVGAWLPRAMEGPTPSSALFYGALSVHAGVYLLLRAAPLLERSPLASAAVLAVGAVTATLATLAGRTQPDVKNSLAFATATQVGLMFVGVGLHLWRWVLLHMTAHTLLRLYQLLRSPSALRDAQALQAALAERPPPRPSLLHRALPAALTARLQRLALHRFFVDDLITRLVVAPALRLSGALDAAERRLLDPPAPPRARDEAAP
jgi:NADH-quinone oxidoreductase subunit L